MQQSQDPTPSVLIISDELKLVESLRGAFGSNCSIFLSPSVTTGLERVASQPLTAVLLNLGLADLDRDKAVAAVRAQCGEDTLVMGFSPAATEAGYFMHHTVPLDGSESEAVALDWRGMRELLTGRTVYSALEATLTPVVAKSAEAFSLFPSEGTSLLDAVPLSVEPASAESLASLRLVHSDTTTELPEVPALEAAEKNIIPFPSSSATPIAEERQRHLLTPYFQTTRLLAGMSAQAKAAIAELVALLHALRLSLEPIHELSPAEERMTLAAVDEALSRLNSLSPEPALPTRQHLLQALNPELKTVPLLTRLRDFEPKQDLPVLLHSLLAPSATEAPSLYAKQVHHWLAQGAIGQEHADAVRMVAEELSAQAEAAASAERPLRVLFLNAGMADELASFLEMSDLSGRADLTLVEPTESLHAQGSAFITQVQRESWRMARTQWLSESPAAGEWDVIHTTLDSQDDTSARASLTTLWERLAPNGTLILRNTTADHAQLPALLWLFHHQPILRTAPELRTLLPASICAEQCRMDHTAGMGTAFLYVTK